MDNEEVAKQLTEERTVEEWYGLFVRLTDRLGGLVFTREGDYSDALQTITELRDMVGETIIEVPLTDAQEAFLNEFLPDWKGEIK